MPPSLVSEDIKILPQSIKNSLGDGINGIKKLMETEQDNKISTKLSKLVSFLKYETELLSCVKKSGKCYIFDVARLI